MTGFHRCALCLRPRQWSRPSHEPWCPIRTRADAMEEHPAGENLTPEARKALAKAQEAQRLADENDLIRQIDDDEVSA